MSSEFEQLVAELEVMVKAQPATEEDKVLAAAKEAGVDTEQIGEADEKPVAKKDDGDGDEDDEDDEDEVLGKSYQATDSEGQSVRAYDATDLIKSLNSRLSRAETILETDTEHLSKSLNLMSDMLKSQSDQIETLQKAMVAMSKQGVGRKAVLTVNEKPEPTMIKSDQPMNPETFMAKAQTAYGAGRISGKDLTTCSVALRIGESIDANLLNRIFAD